MSSPVLCAALLHDVLVDTPYTTAQLRSEFGGEISGLVEKVTRLDQDRSRYGSVAEAIDAAQATGDRRVLIIVHKVRKRRILRTRRLSGTASHSATGLRTGEVKWSYASPTPLEIPGANLILDALSG
jgi:guanosine-3',5'-bis(diphosphate) 3'-pyrophosphohydrolase